MTDAGLYCQGGDFYIDPKKGVKRAIITHAHSDHARRGSQQYYCTSTGAELLRARLGKNISLLTFDYSQTFIIGNIHISFHPAGHILGSSQIRLEQDGHVWVVSGDYKREYDSTSEPFEAIACDVFITEATFGTPSFKWEKSTDHGKNIYEWWVKNQNEGYNSVLIAYSLGKAQRILASLHSFSPKPIFCHPATEKLNQCYRNQGILLAPSRSLDSVSGEHPFLEDLILTPSSFLKNSNKFNLGKYRTAFASGWMKQASNLYDKGFVMSDHADWGDLLLTIKESQARYVYVQHRGTGALVRELRKLGIKAYSDAALYPKFPNQLRLF